MKKIIKSIFLKLPLKNYIIFESAPDFADNTRAVFDELLKRNYNKKYKLIWFMYGNTKPVIKGKNIKFVSANSFKAKYYKSVAKCAICCNHFVYVNRKDSTNFFLQHGTGIKKTSNYYKMPKEINYILSASSGVSYLTKKSHSVSDDKIFSLGFPRNDQLINSNLNVRSLFNNYYEKVIVWYPTVRQFKDGHSTGCKNPLPIIWNEDDAITIDNYARIKKVLIVLKPHFAQDLTNFKKLNLTNIIFINDQFFEEKSITSYQFVGSCDALLTDFSSIYFDYTLCNKPIGLIWEDYEMYNKDPGFSVDMDFMMKGGVKIYNIDELKKFICDVAEGKDLLKEERNEIMKFTNDSNDGKSSMRVTDFIIEKANL